MPFATADTTVAGDLHALLRAAHDASARRENISSQVLKAAAVGSGSYTGSIAAAILSIGGIHGPLAQTQRLLEDRDPVTEAARMLRVGRKVPGWGSSFVKGREDPLWVPVREGLAEVRPDLIATIDAVTTFLQRAGLNIFPNPSAYTAACAIAAGLPAAACAYLFIAGRLEAWTDLFLEATTGGGP